MCVCCLLFDLIDMSQLFMSYLFIFALLELVTLGPRTKLTVDRYLDAQTTGFRICQPLHNRGCLKK